jgi:hypothetical protein
MLFLHKCTEHEIKVVFCVISINLFNMTHIIKYNFSYACCKYFNPHIVNSCNRLVVNLRSS